MEQILENLPLRAKTGATSLQALGLSVRILTESEAENYFGSDYYAGEAVLTSAEVRENKIGGSGHAPEPTTCEHCGKTLCYLGRITPPKSNSAYINDRDPFCSGWSKVPQRCDCPEATEAWAAADAEKKRAQEERDRLERERRHLERVEELLGRSGIKQRFLRRTFENFVTDTPERKWAYETARAYADDFERHSVEGNGLYIEGTFGTGKTHLAAAIALHLIGRERRVIFKTADDLFRDIKETFDKDDGSEQKILTRYKECDLLIIDDLGKEQATDWTTAQLYAILNDRYENQRPVIITTNFNEDGLIAMESPRNVGEHRIRAILSRLHETTTAMTMTGQDWRSK
ncbi:MAG: cell division protein ZapE [Clostridia bacterium]|nr:cell division protein ZapE [Clostridia bacterium]